MLERKPDWASRLDAFLLAHSSDRFRYGQLDCCLFAANAIQAMTGTDLAAWFRGKYRSRQEACDALCAFTGRASVRAVSEKITTEHGMPVIPASRAARGDMLLLKRPKGYSLALVALNGRDALVISSRGIWRLPLPRVVSEVVRAWRV